MATPPDFVYFTRCFGGTRWINILSTSYQRENSPNWHETPHVSVVFSGQSVSVTFRIWSGSLVNRLIKSFSRNSLCTRNVCWSAAYDWVTLPPFCKTKMNRTEARSIITGNSILCGGVSATKISGFRRKPHSRYFRISHGNRELWRNLSRDQKLASDWLQASGRQSVVFRRSYPWWSTVFFAFQLFNNETLSCLSEKSHFQDIKCNLPSYGWFSRRLLLRKVDFAAVVWLKGVAGLCFCCVRFKELNFCHKVCRVNIVDGVWWS